MAVQSPKSSPATPTDAAILPLCALRRESTPFAGGKGANLGELIAAGFPVPDGFVVGAPAYAAFLEATGLRERLADCLAGIDDRDDVALGRCSATARRLLLEAAVPDALQHELATAYEALGSNVAVAVRSSATAEDTAAASFAGMHESFLQVVGTDALVDAVRQCWASLFGARAIAYRVHRGEGLADVDIAVVVQRQIAATRAGVMFTVDPVSGAADCIVIEAALGLGESVVKGDVTPDRFVVDKATLAVLHEEVHYKETELDVNAGGAGTVRRAPVADAAGRAALTEAEVTALAVLGRRIEQHYGSPQDTEWAIDVTGATWILQARPVTTMQGAAAEAGATAGVAESTATGGARLTKGLGAAPGVASGPVRVVRSLEDAARVGAGDVLVAHMTAPDWVPVMRRAGAVVTDLGGMTCHAAIVSRELGVPCVVGAGDATMLREGTVVTVDGTTGIVTSGAAAPAPPAGQAGTTIRAARLESAPVTATQVLVNLSEPSQVARVAALDVDGVGLLRAELMVLEALEGVHPRLLLERGRGDDFVERMAAGLEAFAAGFAPRSVTYRTIDFRTNEFRGLEGGERFEPQEANPMIGYRGAARYVREPDLFRLELDAVARVWDAGRRNLHVMLPFVRAPREVEICRRLLDDAGLLGRPGFELWLMAEVPSILFHLRRYAELGIAGISIGSNDLTQLLLGVDRDSGDLTALYDERDEAVTAAITRLVAEARALRLRSSICGQAPSVYPEYADLLVRAGIDAISVSADAVERVRRLVAAAEQRVLLRAAGR